MFSKESLAEKLLSQMVEAAHTPCLRYSNWLKVFPFRHTTSFPKFSLECKTFLDRGQKTGSGTPFLSDLDKTSPNLFATKMGFPKRLKCRNKK